MKYMKKIFLAICAIALLATCAFASPPELVSESAVLIDADTGQILYGKDMHRQMYPASITKILTVITGLERLPMEETMTMSHYAVFSIPVGSSHIALDEDEVITMEQAVYAALLMSANDACNGIAERIGGSISAYADMMNETAKKAGAINSNFVNPHGLYDENHYTTAYDMAMICRYALQNETFKEVFGTYKYVMQPTNEQPEERTFINQHDMISDPNMKYEGIIGGKEGWTSVSKCTLVTAAERDGRTLVAVVMKCVKDADKYADTKALLDYGFEGYSENVISPTDIPEELKCEIDENVSVWLPHGQLKTELIFDKISENGEEFLVISTENEETFLMPSEAAGEETNEVAAEKSESAGKVKNELLRVPCKTKIENPLVKLGEKSGGTTFIIVICKIFLGIVAFIIIGIGAIYLRKKIYRARRKYRRRKRR